MGAVEVGEDGFAVGFFFRVGLGAGVGFEVFLDGEVAGGDLGALVLD